MRAFSFPRPLQNDSPTRAHVVCASGKKRMAAVRIGFFPILLWLASASTCRNSYLGKLEDQPAGTTSSIEISSSGACTETPIDIVLVTDDSYYDQRTTDDYLLARSLAALGRRVERVSYQDANFNWASSKTVLMRSAWIPFYYKQNFEEFYSFYDETSSRTAFFNYDVDQWTKTKEHYTWDLARAGINTLDFVYITPDNVTTLDNIMSQNNWDAVVFKPATHSEVLEMVTRENVGQKELIWQRHSNHSNMIVQNFQSNIAKGEVSIIFIGDVYSHAVLKVPEEGEFNIHDGYAYLHQPTDEEMAFAQHVYSAMTQHGFSPVFAKIDIVRDNDGALALMELQIRSALLYLSLYPEAAEALAVVLDNTIDNVAQANTCAWNAWNQTRCHGPGYFDNSQYFFEDEIWDRLPRDVQEAAILLGYTSEKWDNSEGWADLSPDQDWMDLSPDQRELLRILGFTEARVSVVCGMRRPPCIYDCSTYDISQLTINCTSTHFNLLKSGRTGLTKRMKL